jgi:glycosyltransferase involved in cell wall biosynthesis
MISIAICTWNRAPILSECLERIAACQPPACGEWEVVVVNNNCTDDTDVVLESYSKRLPLRRIFEPRPGVANARNAAVDAVRGDHMLWTDDDVRVNPDWIVEYEKAFQAHPDIAFFGGPIRPHYENPPPEWFTRCLPYFWSAFALRELGTEPIELDRHKYPFGANWAVRTAAQRAVRYDPRLGRRPTDPALGGEEIQVMDDLFQLGHRARWVPSAGVGHLIGRDRQTLSYVKRFYRGIGRTTTVTDPVPGRALAAYRAPWLLRQAAKAWWRYRVAKWTQGEEKWAPLLIESSIMIGRAAAKGVPRSRESARTIVERT